MLKFMPTNDKKLLDSLSLSIFDCDYQGEVGFVLSKSSESIGIAKIYCSPELSKIIKIGIVPEQRKKGFGDFFTRSLLLKMSLVSSKITIEYASDYYKKFGFIEENGQMSIESDKIVFPSACKKGV